MMYQLRISKLGSRSTLKATDSGRVDGQWDYHSFDDLCSRLGDLGVSASELVIPHLHPGEPQEIVLGDHRFRGSVLAEVLGNHK